MRRPPITAAILTARASALGLSLGLSMGLSLGLVAPVMAQTGPAPSSANAAGLRYLTWPGRTYRPVAASPAATPGAAEAAPVPVVAAPSRPPIIPHGGRLAAVYAAAPTPSAAPRQGLTPASAWIASQAPAYAPQPAVPVQGPLNAPTPQPYLAPAPAAAPWSRARAAAPAPVPAAPAPVPTGYFAETAEAASPPMPVADPAPPAPRRAPAAAPVMASAPADAPPPAPVADPMAPRRDAPIFRLQRPSTQAEAAPAVQAQAQAQAQPSQPMPAADAPAAQGGARYYSVHRQAGRQPDATPLPAPVYLDALPVELTSAPASTDLAEPPAAPNLIRNANGRLQALPANEDPVLP